MFKAKGNHIFDAFIKNSHLVFFNDPFIGWIWEHGWAYQNSSPWKYLLKKSWSSLELDVPKAYVLHWAAVSGGELIWWGEKCVRENLYNLKWKSFISIKSAFCNPIFCYREVMFYQFLNNRPLKGWKLFKAHWHPWKSMKTSWIYSVGMQKVLEGTTVQ